MPVEEELDHYHDWDALEYSEPMSKQQIEEIFKRLKKLEGDGTTVSPHLPVPPSTREPWAKRNSYWLFPSLTVLLGSGFVVGYFGLVVDSRIDAKLAAPLKQIGDQSSALARMDGRLSGLSDLLSIVVQNESKRTAALPLNEFQKDLSAVSGLLTVAKNETRLAIGAPDTDAIRRKILEANHDAPDYWKAATAMVNYRSPVSDDSALPPCTNHPMDVNPAGGTAVVEKCQMQLDGPMAPLIYAMLMRYGLNLYFKNCLITYRGGPIALPAIQRLIFLDCRFDFSVQGNPEPPPAAKLVLKALLSATDLKRVEVPVSQTS